MEPSLSVGLQGGIGNEDAWTLESRKMEWRHRIPQSLVLNRRYADWLETQGSNSSMIALLIVAMISGSFVATFVALGLMLLVSEDKISLPGTSRAKLHDAQRDLVRSETRFLKEQKELAVLDLNEMRLQKAISQRSQGESL